MPTAGIYEALRLQPGQHYRLFCGAISEAMDMEDGGHLMQLLIMRPCSNLECGCRSRYRLGMSWNYETDGTWYGEDREFKYSVRREVKA